MKMTNQKEVEFWTIDELENAIDNLEMLNLALSQPPSIKWWKWAMIATHQALYTFAIAALSGTSPLHNVFRLDFVTQAHILRLYGDKDIPEIAKELNKSIEKVEEALREEPHLLSIGNALSRLQADGQEGFLPWSNSEPLRMSDVEQRAIDRLINEFRNDFEHFHPKSWAIHPHVLSEVLIPTVRVIRFIALESNCIMYHRDEDLQMIVNVLGAIDAKLVELEALA
jgi:hypothetical protein